MRPQFERCSRLFIDRSHTAVNREWQAGQCLAKQTAFDMPQGQYPTDNSAAFRIQKIAVVTKNILDQYLPARAMKERSLGAGHDKCIPPGDIDAIAPIKPLNG